MKRKLLVLLPLVMAGILIAVATASGGERLAFNHDFGTRAALDMGDEAFGAGSFSVEKAVAEKESAGTTERALDRAMRRLEERLASDRTDYEARLLRGLIHFRRGEHNAALADMDLLVEKAPEFHLAHLVRGDLLLSRSKAVSDIGYNGIIEGLGEKEGGDGLSRTALRKEAQRRIEGYLDSLYADRIPGALITLADNVGTAILVDKSRNRLYLFENTGSDQPPRRIRDYYVSTGQAEGNKYVEGDLRTPEGVYFVQNYISDRQLPDLYGRGAFTLDYPNALDRRKGKTGYGIWLHGTESGYYSRPPLDSEGCVVLPNLDLEAIKPFIEPGRTPVIIAERLEWITEEAWENRRSELMATLEGWRYDWESMDVERYLARYDDEFWSPSRERAQWDEYKQAVMAGKTEQDIRLEDITLLGYPPEASGGERLVVAQFRQYYDSNNYRGTMDKRLYLRRDYDRWNILFEGAAR